MLRFYTCIFERNSEGKIFANVPDLPGANAMGTDELQALLLITEIAKDYVVDLLASGHPVPQARGWNEIEIDPEVPEIGRSQIPVWVPA